jgi:RNA polymerase sigma-70 factor (ECF subfamily)
VSVPVSGTEEAAASLKRELIDTLYSSYWQDLCRYVRAKFGAGPPEPADVAQTAFARFAALKDAGAVDNPKAFLYATARNIVVDHHRRVQTQAAYARTILDDAEEEILDGITPERVLIGKETLQIMRQTIRRLPHKQRRVLLLHRLHNQSFTEISQRTGWSQSDVRRQVCRAMAAIEKAVERAGR